MADHRVAALDRVLELALLLHEDLERSLPALGLTEARVKVVWVLHQSGPCAQRDLARALDVAPRTVTGLVDALEDTGFVARRPHPTDRRATLVALTDHGAEVAATLAAGQVEFADQLFGGIEPGELAAFVRTLGATVERLRGLLEAGA